MITFLDIVNQNTHRIFLFSTKTQTIYKRKICENTSPYQLDQLIIRKTYLTAKFHRKTTQDPNY